MFSPDLLNSLSYLDAYADKLIARPLGSPDYLFGSLLALLIACVTKCEGEGQIAELSSLYKSVSKWAAEQMIDGRKVKDIASEIVARVTGENN